MKQAYSYLLERFSEASTWRGIIVGLTGVGVGISPDLATGIVSAGMSLAGLVGIVMKDK